MFKVSQTSCKLRLARSTFSLLALPHEASTVPIAGPGTQLGHRRPLCNPHPVTPSFLRNPAHVVHSWAGLSAWNNNLLEVRLPKSAPLPNQSNLRTLAAHKRLDACICFIRINKCANKALHHRTPSHPPQ